MEGFKKFFRGRIIPEGDTVKEIPIPEDGRLDGETLERKLDEVNKQLRSPGLSEEDLRKLWQERKNLEGKLSLGGEKKDPSTGQYL